MPLNLWDLPRSSELRDRPGRFGRRAAAEDGRALSALHGRWPPTLSDSLAPRALPACGDPRSASTGWHVEAFIADQLTRWKPATAANRYGGLRAFFKWAVEEGEISKNPMARMRPPQVGEPQIPNPHVSGDRAPVRSLQGAGFRGAPRPRAAEDVHNQGRAQGGDRRNGGGRCGHEQSRGAAQGKGRSPTRRWPGCPHRAGP